MFRSGILLQSMSLRASLQLLFLPADLVRCLMYSQPAGTLCLEAPNLHCLPTREFQHWLWQVGVLQRSFPNSILKLDDVVRTAPEHNIRHLLSCTELRDVTIRLTPAPGRQAVATLGRLHGSRLQLQVPADAFPMLCAEPMLATHVSQAALPSR